MGDEMPSCDTVWRDTTSFLTFPVSGCSQDYSASTFVKIVSVSSCSLKQNHFRTIPMKGCHVARCSQGNSRLEKASPWHQVAFWWCGSGSHKTRGAWHKKVVPAGNSKPVDSWWELRCSSCQCLLEIHKNNWTKELVCIVLWLNQAWGLPRTCPFAGRPCIWEGPRMPYKSSSDQRGFSHCLIDSRTFWCWILHPPATQILALIHVICPAGS